MTDRPILFSAPMIREILADRKTQTRRVVKPAGALLAMSWSPLHPERGLRVTTRTGKHQTHTGPVAEALSACPYGQPGDRLWVRETWAQEDARDLGLGASQTLYRATATDAEAALVQRWRPSIHMPRWASRLTLEVTSVRVERLHAITEFDAIAEGVEPEPGMERWRNYVSEFEGVRTTYVCARDSFFSLWESINGVESLAANPWVWVVGFKRVEVRHG